MQILWTWLLLESLLSNLSKKQYKNTVYICHFYILLFRRRSVLSSAKRVTRSKRVNNKMQKAVWKHSIFTNFVLYPLNLCQISQLCMVCTFKFQLLKNWENLINPKTIYLTYSEKMQMLKVTDMHEILQTNNALKYIWTSTQQILAK